VLIILTKNDNSENVNDEMIYAKLIFEGDPQEFLEFIWCRSNQNLEFLLPIICIFKTVALRLCVYNFAGLSTSFRNQSENSFTRLK
jgi:hypothetical protein